MFKRIYRGSWVALALVCCGATASAQEFSTTPQCVEPVASNSYRTRLEEVRSYKRCLEDRARMKRAVIAAQSGSNVRSLSLELQSPAAGTAAQDLQSETLQLNETEAKLEQTMNEEEELESFVDYLKPNFGIGIAGAFGNGAQRVNKASIDSNGIVRVEEDVTDSPRLALEAHRYWQLPKTGGRVGIGPFAMLNFGATDGDTLTSVALGLMFGFKGNVTGTKSLNIGLGYALDKGVKRLRADFVDGEAAPLDDMGAPIDPVFRTSSEKAFVVVFSVTPDF